MASEKVLVPFSFHPKNKSEDNFLPSDKGAYQHRGSTVVRQGLSTTTIATAMFQLLFRTEAARPESQDNPMNGGLLRIAKRKQNLTCFTCHKHGRRRRRRGKRIVSRIVLHSLFDGDD